jgi:iron complex outermembrane receptor protein
VLLLAPIANSQTAAEQDTSAAQQDEETLTIEVITVTARKRNESLQKTPLSISALTETDIERAGIDSLEDIAALSPGLSFNSYMAGNFSVPTIRGLAQTDITNVENNVSVFLNGIYLSNKSNLDMSLLDIRQIEVIRGPQSALFGRNSFAGSINYQTARPSNELGGNIQAELGSDEKRVLSGVVNLPISDTLNGRFAASYSSFDGTITNSADTSDNLGGYKKQAVSASFAWLPNDDLSVDLFLYYNEEENDHTPALQVNNNCGLGVAGFGGFTIPVFGSYCSDMPSSDTADIDPRATGAEKESFFVGLNFDYQLGNGTLSGLLGYSDTQSKDIGDGDFTSQGTDYLIYNFQTFGVVGTINLDTFNGNRFENEDSSVELRYRSDADKPFRWMFGVAHANTEFTDILFQSVVGDASGLAPLTGAFLPPGVTVTDDPANFTDLNVSKYDFTSLAIFTELEMDFSEQLTGTLELRYTNESRDADLSLSVGSPGPGLLSEDYSSVTPRFIVSYDIDEDSLLYSSVAKGVKSGGFNNTSSSAPEDLVYDAESNWSYEVGYKTSFAGGRFQTNAALFYVDWKDLQNKSFGESNLAITTNVGDAEVMGAEFSLRAALTDKLTANLGYAYAQPKYDDDTTTTSARRECGVPATVCQRDPVTGEAFIGGNQLARTSEHQLNLSTTYAWELSNNWAAFVRTDISHQSKQPNEINQNAVGARTLANARFGMENETYLIQLWVNNLTNEQYSRSQLFFNVPDAFPVFSYKSVLGDLRSFGINVKMIF